VIELPMPFAMRRTSLNEAQLLTSMARDAGEEGVHAAKRAIRRVRRRGVEALEDFSEEAAHYVKRQPLKAVGIAVGAGLLTGAVVGWIGGRLAQQRSCNS
jgi:ElaB/YqjD/DUF883 family membrane-anchored ribosome-binding protein